MTRLILSLAAAAGLGLGCWMWLQPGPRPRGADLLLTASVSVALGLGLASTTFFLWAVVLRLSPGSLLDIEIALAALLVLWGIWAARGRRTELPRGERWSFLDGLLTLGFLLAVALAAYGFLCRSIREPHGLWDAWAIWNLRARFLFRGGEYWRDGLSPLLSWSHPDYPLLVPGVIARGWTFAGGETTAVPIAVDFLFTFATAGILAAAVWGLRGRTQGMLAGLTLLGTPFFVAHGAAQYAEIPIAGYLLASLALLHRADQASQGVGGTYALAGLLAGMAAWTKNEGLLFLAVLLVAQVVSILWRGTWSQDWQRLVAFGVGALPMLLLISSFKVFLGPPTDLLAGQSLDTITARLADPSRYLQVATAFAKEFLDRGKWNFLPVVLPFYGLLVGAKMGEHAAVGQGTDSAGVGQRLATTWGALALMAAGFFLVYLLTPRDLAWHLRTTVDRIFLELWPSMLLATFLTIGAPDSDGTASESEAKIRIPSAG